MEETDGQNHRHIVQLGECDAGSKMYSNARNVFCGPCGTQAIFSKHLREADWTIQQHGRKGYHGAVDGEPKRPLGLGCRGQELWRTTGLRPCEKAV